MMNPVWLRGMGLAALAFLVAAPTGLLVKWLSARYDPLQITAYRMLFGLVVVIIIAFFLRQVPWRTRTPWTQWLRAGLSVLSVWLAFILFQEASLATAAAINLAPPLISVPLAMLLMGETVSRWQWMGLVLGCAGCAMVIGVSDSVFTIGGVALALIAVSAADPLMLRRLSTEDRPLATTFYLSLCGALFLGAQAGGEALQFFDVSGFVALAVFATVAQLILAQAYHYAPVAVLAPMAYVSVLLASGMDIFILQTPLSPGTLAGAVLVASGCVLSARQSR